MRILGESLKARSYEKLNQKYSFPDDGYQGDYIIEIAKSIIDHYGKELEKDDKKLLSHAEKIIFKQIKNSLNSLGIQFDTFANEKSFYESGAIKTLLSDLEEKELIVRQ